MRQVKENKKKKGRLNKIIYIYIYIYKKHLSETETVMFYLDFVDQFYPVENKVQTVSKEKSVKEDNIVVSSSHPPQKTIVFQHRTTTVKASPFKVASKTSDVKKVIEQNNYTN
jgi:hypothetical protein